ncbi:MAG: D-alanyl-D-alanine carboxypeptidase/D-alanyl-D-alanine-endopeptidase [Gammaproteobacteria bacterium]|nr:D-alanyl-D-alanine carboxypeptidase/D-alanyl-D-alanine-endopeptidase [Gammaproteobacteria bacterium]
MEATPAAVSRPGRPLFLAVLLLVCASPAWAAEAGAGLPEPVSQAARRLGIPESSLGVIVQEIGVATPMVSVNPDSSRNPASTIKVITTLAALELLGPTYSWPTEVFTTVPVKAGVLDGDLIIKGYGDPFLMTEEFWKLVQALRRQGLETINGDLVIDNSYFFVPHTDPGEFDNRPFHAYNVRPHALLVNLKAVYFHFYPGADNKSVIIKTEPELPNLKIDNRLIPAGGRCGGYQHGIAMTVPEPDIADRVIFEGRYALACGHYVFARSVLTPETFAYGVFKALWEQSGGALSGSVRNGVAGPELRPWLIWNSRPLAEVIRYVNKFSNNVMTRQILLTLGAEIAGEPGTVDGGIQAVRQYLQEIGISPEPLVIENGSGLSRAERVTPRLMADALLHANSIPFMPEFIASLSIIGMDGTARNRLKRHTESGHAHVKTGTIDNVSAIAGYVDAESGRRFVLIGLLNHPEVQYRTGEQIWNALIQWAYKL